jgi:intracellular sulfur oxidation DsrE/DsrF family protein
MSKEAAPVARRSFLAKVGIGMSAWTASFGAAQARAQTASTADASEKAWRPTRHAQDDWFDRLPGQHRFVVDTTSYEGFGEALRYVSNFYAANQSGYGLGNSDLAVVIIARHMSTVCAFNDAMWSKYSEALAARAKAQDPSTKQAPKVNLYNAAALVGQLPSGGVTLDSLLKRGVHLAVCEMATRFLATGVAKASGGTVDAAYAELTANLVGNAHMVAAGIVAVNRAQERGYTFASLGA